MDKDNPRKGIIGEINPKYAHWFNPPKIEPFDLAHIRIRECLKEPVDKWCSDFIDRVSRTTNYEEFIWLNLSPEAVEFKLTGYLHFSRIKYGQSPYFKLGYMDAVRGNDPYIDEINYNGNTLAAEGKMNDKLWNYMDGYYQALLDHFVNNYNSKRLKDGVADTREPSKLTILLTKFYENGGKDLQDYHFDALSQESGIAKGTLVARWKLVRRDGFEWTKNPKNIKEWKKSFVKLLEKFHGTNPSALSLVQTDHDKLKKEHPKYFE